MLYQATFTVQTAPEDVFAATHEYKLRQRPAEFFSFLSLEKLVKMEFRVLTPHALGLGATYDWTFRVLGTPILVFQEKIIDWVDGRTTSYRAVSGWNMTFRIDVEAEDGGSRVTEQIDISTGIPFTDRLFRGFIEWGLKRVGKKLVERGLKAIEQPLLCAD